MQKKLIEISYLFAMFIVAMIGLISNNILEEIVCIIIVFVGLLNFRKHFD